jgi:hypothetical protein
MLAEHAMKIVRAVHFDQTHKLHRTTTYIDRMVKEAIEIQLHPVNFNREDGYILSRAWYPLINVLKHQPGKQVRLNEQSYPSTSGNCLHPLPRLDWRQV